MIEQENVNSFLLDGQPTGVIECSVPFWSGKIFKIPRTKLDDCKDYPELKQSGIYFLLGEDENLGKKVAYVGQARTRQNDEGILNRLREHRADTRKSYWTEALVVTSDNNALGSTEISYLENAFYKLAKEANRYEIKNENLPSKGNMTKQQISSMLKFIEMTKKIIGTIGYKIFIPLVGITTEKNKNDSEEIFYLRRKCKGSDVDAMAKQTDEGFVVLKGSRIAEGEAPNIRCRSVHEKRAKAKRDRKGLLAENILFKSPSGGAMFVVANSANGLTEWKNKDGKSIKDLKR